MARIRSFKPEAPTHRKVGRLSIWARWLWFVCITQADDEGRLVADPGQLRLLAFGYDSKITDGRVMQLLEEIQATGLIRLYQSGGEPYLDFPSWKDHQRIDHPTKSKLPPFQDISEPREDSPNAREDSRLSAGARADRIGSDRKGSDLSCRVNGTRPEVGVLEFLNQKTGKHFRAVGTNLGLIRDRLRDGIHDWQLRAIVSRKTHEWRGTEREMYLRPATLFNKTKCEQYLGELPAETDDA